MINSIEELVRINKLRNKTTKTTNIFNSCVGGNACTCEYRDEEIIETDEDRIINFVADFLLECEEGVIIECKEILYAIFEEFGSDFKSSEYISTILNNEFEMNLTPSVVAAYKAAWARF
ncbi:MAG: hypothetical protein RBR68_07330 [Tenuifilaceae bacterium]|nr:hypothetical protein [Tenuifilaceae bacterium]